MDLTPFIMKGQCECLNESDEHSLAHALTANGGYLESDCDEQLIISISFTQVVKIHSIKIKAPMDKGPKNVKLFINQPRTIDFDMADSNTSVQNLEYVFNKFFSFFYFILLINCILIIKNFYRFRLSVKDIEEGNPIQLRYVKFQNVQNLQIFVKDNQSDSETTQIDHLVIIGSPVSTTDMNSFKRVIGKKGEGH